MQICIVKGQIVSTNKSERLVGSKILLVQPYDINTFEEKGNPFVSIDSVGAGEGDVVMTVGGSSARNAEKMSDKPVDSCIIAIIDSVDIEGQMVYQKTVSKKVKK